MNGRSCRVSWDPEGKTRVTIASLLLGISGCSFQAMAPNGQPATAQASAASSASSSDWQAVADVLGHKGELREEVYTVRVPRDDLFVSIEGMDVPTAAGIESTFRFYHCTCGKTVVIGEFVLADYETNDVLYALQKEDILISSVAPYLLYERPRLMQVRFQAEGEARHLVEAIKSALNWTGKNRMPAQKPASPR
jgi:hypothetical protein